jgi:uncharacterized protein (TIGR02001 family)
MILALALALASPAHAQLGFGAAVESDDRVRGLSLSDGRPTLNLSFSYDSPSGLYGGGTAIGVDTRSSGLQPLGYVVYAGYAVKMSPSVAWDAGVTNNQVTVYLDRKYTDNYTELYAGFTERDVSAHIYYSPNYLDDSGGVIYIDVDGAVRPADRWRLFGHAGVLTPLNSTGPSGGGGPRFDLQAGVAREFTHADVHLSWVATTPTPVFPPDRRQARNVMVLGAAYFF